MACVTAGLVGRAPSVTLNSAPTIATTMANASMSSVAATLVGKGLVVRLRSALMIAVDTATVWRVNVCATPCGRDWIAVSSSARTSAMVMESALRVCASASSNMRESTAQNERVQRVVTVEHAITVPVNATKDGPAVSVHVAPAQMTVVVTGHAYVASANAMWASPGHHAEPSCAKVTVANMVCVLEDHACAKGVGAERTALYLDVPKIVPIMDNAWKVNVAAYPTTMVKLVR